METIAPRTTIADAEAICIIYNQGIEDRIATLETERRTPEERRQWLAGRRQRHPVIVAEVQGRVVGWGSLNSLQSPTLSMMPWPTFPSMSNAAGGGMALDGVCSKNSSPWHRASAITKWCWRLSPSIRSVSRCTSGWIHRCRRVSRARAAGRAMGSTSSSWKNCSDQGSACKSHPMIDVDQEVLHRSLVPTPRRHVTTTRQRGVFTAGVLGCHPRLTETCNLLGVFCIMRLRCS